MAQMIPNGAIELYHNNSKKFETTSSGVQLSSPDSRLLWPVSAHSSSRAWGFIGEQNAYGEFELRCSNGQDNTLDEVAIQANVNGNVELYYDNSKKFETTSNGISVGSITLDSTFNNIGLPDGGQLRFGAGEDLRIYHDATAGNTNFIKATNSRNIYILADDVAILNEAGNQTSIWCNSGASVELMYANSKKFETTNTGVNVTGALTVNGAALSSAPTITATVDGSISANDPVIVKSTGNIEKVAETITINNPASYVANRQNGPNNQTGSFLIVASSQKKSVLMLYQDGQNNDRARYDIVRYNGSNFGSGNWGANKTFDGGGITLHDSCYSPLTNQIMILSRKWSSNNRLCVGNGRFNDWTGNGGNDEGEDIDWNAKVSAIGNNNDLGTSTGSFARCACDQEYGHFYMVFHDDNDDYLNCYYAASSTTGGIGIDNTRSLPNGTDTIRESVAVGAGGEKVLVIYQNDSAAGNSGKTYIRAGKYDASATGKVTWGSEVELSGQSSDTSGLYYDISYNEKESAFVIVWTDSQVPKVKAVTVNSSLVITQGSPVTLDSDDSTHTSVGYDVTTKSNPCAWRRNSDGDGHVRIATVSGTTVTLNSTFWEWNDNNVKYAANGQKFQIQDMKSYGHSMLGSRHNGNQYGDLRAFTPGSSTTTLTTENFIGFSSAAYSNGNTGTVNVIGNTTTKSGLTPGQTYYVQRDGNIKTSADTTVGTVKAGTSLSSTKLLIN